MRLALPDKVNDCDREERNDDPVESPPGLVGNRIGTLDFFLSFETFWRELIGP